MPRKIQAQKSAANVMILGVGSFAHSIGSALADAGANVSTHWMCTGIFRQHWSAKLFRATLFPALFRLIRENKIEVVIPQSIDWAQQPWTQDLLKSEKAR